MTTTYSPFPVVEVSPQSAPLVEFSTVDAPIIEVSTDEPPVIDIVAIGERGEKGDRGPEVAWFDFSRRGVVAGPYISPLRRYVDRAALLDRIIVSVGTSPIGAAFEVDLLKNGVSLFPGGLGRPTIQPGAARSFITTSKIFSPDDYLQVSVVSGIASDLTVSTHLTYDLS